MLAIPTLLVVTHIVGNFVWIGSILAVAVVASDAATDARTRGKLALAVYKRLAVPAFVVSFAAALARLLLDLNYYFVATKFMHAKLLFALIVIAVHHVIGARAKSLASGKSSESGATPTLATVLFLSALATAIIALTKPF